MSRIPCVAAPRRLHRPLSASSPRKPTARARRAARARAPATRTSSSRRTRDALKVRRASTVDPLGKARVRFQSCPSIQLARATRIVGRCIPVSRAPLALAPTSSTVPRGDFTHRLFALRESSFQEQLMARSSAPATAGESKSAASSAGRKRGGAEARDEPRKDPRADGATKPAAGTLARGDVKRASQGHKGAGKDDKAKSEASPAPKKKTSEIDDLFAGIKATKASAAASKPAKASAEEPNAKRHKIVGSKDDIFGEEEGGPRKRTEEGFRIFSEEELGLLKSGGETDNCPFDCDCCY